MEKWLDTETIATWIIIVFLLVTLLAVSVIKLVFIHMKKTMEHKLKESWLKVEYQNKLLKSTLEAQEKERNRIASDLHDSIIGKLTVLRLKSQLNYKAEEIDSLLADSINEIRQISHNLSPPMIDFKNISELIGDVVLSWRTKFECNYYKNIQAELNLSEKLKIQLVRIAQEVINNSHKHSQSKSITVILKTTAKYVYLVVSDNGIGFDSKSEKSSGGIGLNNIASRVHYLKGHHKIKSDKNGTRFIFVFNILS